MPEKIFIRFGKRCAAKKTVMRGQRRGVHACQHQMPLPVNFGTFFLCFAAPQHKHKMLSVLIELIYHRIRESGERQRMELRSRIGVAHSKLLEVVETMEGSLEEPMSCAELMD